MPTRLFNGEKAWGSAKIARLPEEMKAEYAWMHPIALDDGSFEADPVVVWRAAYAGHRRKNAAEVGEILDEFARRKLLFRWLQVGQRAMPYAVDFAGNHQGTIWGFWTNIDKPGRLPAPSDRRNVGPGVPAKLLKKFLGCKEREQQLSLVANQAAPRKGLGRRQGQAGTPPGAGSPGLDWEGKGKGVGVGLGTEEAEKTVSPASSSSSPLSSSLRSSSAGSSSSDAGEGESPAKKKSAEVLKVNPKKHPRFAKELEKLKA